MMKPSSSISFWDGSSQIIHSYLNMEKRLYGMFGANYQNSLGSYFMQFKIGKDGMNDTAKYLTFNKLHGRITPKIHEDNKVILFDFWEFPETDVNNFLYALEENIFYYLTHASVNEENYKTSSLLAGAIVNINGVTTLKDSKVFQIAKKFQKKYVPPLKEISLP